MSNHKDQRPDLVAALKCHHLAHDTPSQLSDAFRLGWDARADLPPTTAQLMSDPRVKALVEALGEARRAIGDHFAPMDCYTTGPLTGNWHRDMVECPACAFIAAHDAALAQIKEPKP